jgi:AbrB family looped-hinge helix DNA binding protein
VTIPKEVREALHLESGDIVVYEINEDATATLRRVEPYDAGFHLAVSDTLDEWASDDDDEAFRDL